MKRTTRVKKRYLEHAFVGVFSSLIVAPMFVIGAGYIDDTSTQLFNTARIVTERAIESTNNAITASFQSSPTNQTSQLAVVIESEPFNTVSIEQQGFISRIISSILKFFSSLFGINETPIISIDTTVPLGEVSYTPAPPVAPEVVELFTPPVETETQPARHAQTQDQTPDTSNPTPPPIQPRERVIERIVERTVPSPTPAPFPAQTLVAGVSESAMDEKFIQLSNALKAEIYRVEANASRQGNGNFSAIALTQRIDNLANVTISNATMSGSNISNTTISGSAFSGALGNITDLTATNFTTTNSTTGNATTTNLAVSGSSYFSTLTAGSVPFIGANGLLSQNNSQIFWDSINSRLGIGTSTPYAKLSVAGEVVGSHFTATTTTDNTFPNLVAVNATTTNATSTSFFSATASITDFIAGNSTTTNATSTNSFATTASSTSLFSQFASIVGLNVSNSTTTNATSTSFYSTNIFGANSDITNSTSTNSFATTASSTNLFTSNFSLGSISGFLKATAGAVTNALVNLTTDITGILGIANGGTNNSSFSTDSLTYFDGTRLTSTSSPMVGYITATSTTATSTFAGGLTAGTNGLTVLQSGNVGIGTTNPATITRLEVTGGSASAVTTTIGEGIYSLLTTNTASSNKQWGIISRGNNIAIREAGILDAMTFQAGGNVGIGATEITSKLAVSATNLTIVSGAVAQTLLSTATAIGDRLGIAFSQDGVETRARAGIFAVAERANGYASSLGFYARDAEDGSALANTDEKMRITSTGNVGIGTTGPQGRLEVNNRNTATGAALFIAGGEDDLSPVAGQYTGINFGYGGAANYNGGGIFYEFTDANANGKLEFAVKSLSGVGTANLSDTKMTILNSGNVGIGTTTPWLALSVKNTNANGQFVASYDDSNYATLTVDATGDLKFLTNGGDIFALRENLWVCDNGGCPTLTATSTAGNIFAENAVTFGNGFSLNQISTTELGFYNASGTVMVIFDDLQ